MLPLSKCLGIRRTLFAPSLKQLLHTSAFLAIPLLTATACNSQCTYVQNTPVYASFEADTSNDNSPAPPVDCHNALTLHKGTRLFAWSVASNQCCLDGATAQWQVHLTLSNGRTIFSQSGQLNLSNPFINGQIVDVSADTRDGDVVLTAHASITPKSDSYPDGWYIATWFGYAGCNVVGRVDNGNWSEVYTGGYPYYNGNYGPVAASVPLGGTLQLRLRSDPLGFLALSSQISDQQVATQSLDNNALFTTVSLYP